MATTQSQSFNMNANALTQIWNFPKLKGQENYQPWSKKMRSALKYCGLWEVVDQGIGIFPDDPPTAPAPTAVQAAAYELAESCLLNLDRLPVCAPVSTPPASVQQIDACITRTPTH